MATSAPAQTAGEQYSRIAHPMHLVLVLAIQGFFVFRAVTHPDRLHEALSAGRGNFYLRNSLSAWLMLGFVMLGVWLSGAPIATVLGARWRSLRQFLQDVGIGLAFWVVSTGLLSVLHGHGQGAAPGSAVQSMLPQSATEMALWSVMSVSAGICEEAIYRGYLQRQFTALTRNVPAGIILSAAMFGASHVYQGLRGALPIALLGALTGILAHWRGSVRPGMISHAWQDVFAGMMARAMKIPVG